MFKKVIMSIPNQRKEMIGRIATATCSSTTTVYRWMSGAISVPPLKQRVIADLLGKPVEELFPVQEQKGGEV